MPDDARLAEAETARRDGNPLALYDIAQSAIAAGEDAARYRYLQVLALAQMGDLSRSTQLYDLFDLGARPDDEDALALRGRLYKDRARAAPPGLQRDLFRQASAAYLLAHDVRQGYFPAINAATTAWAAGDQARAGELATQVLSHPDLRAPRDFFANASRAEALLLLGRVREAGQAILAALDRDGVGHGERASTYRQMEWLCAQIALGAAERHAILGPLRPPPVITYTGHMFQADQGERPLAAAISDALEALGSTIGYGALACGSDILFAEDVLRRGGALHVVLPFLADDFIEASVRPGGESWVERFHQCLGKATSVTIASRAGYVADDGQFAYGAQLAMGLATLRASQIAADAVQLAVWDGQPAHRPAGAAVDVTAWRALGRESRVIDPGAIDRGVSHPKRPGGSPEIKRVTRAMIFSDYKGFSKLPEAATPAFNREVMGRVAGVLGRHPDAICTRNTWGDALYAVITNTADAAVIALDILEALKDIRFGPAETRDEEGMRIGMHFGPVYQGIDPVTGQDSFYGLEVTLAARIEPIAIPGEIYTTQAFAAILAVTAPDRFASRYIGRLELAKGYGDIPVYRLERRV